MPDLYPYQEDGARWLADRTRAMLFDEQGLGKTVTTIRAADLIEPRRVLCVVPSVVLWNWEREWHHWSRREDLLTQVIPNGKTRVAPGADVVIVTHGLLLSPMVRADLIRQTWDLVILDEAHFFRSPSAKRVQILYGDTRTPAEDTVVGHAMRCWILTGTPCPNNASELWTHLYNLAPSAIMGGDGKPRKHSSFVSHFCKSYLTRWGRKIIGNKHVDELREGMAPYVLRRTKKECLRDLPDIRFEMMTVKPDLMPWEIVELDGKLRPEMTEALRERPDARPEEGFSALRGDTAFARFRQLCGLAKIRPAAALLDMELAEGGLGKVVVFAHHTAVIAGLDELLGKYGTVRITGATSAKAREQAIRAFQEDDSVRVALCQIVAGGTGATLTAASDVVFVEMSFVPGENAQAADRCHRIGQTERVRVRFLALAGTVDEDIVSALRTKTQMIREVLE